MKHFYTLLLLLCISSISYGQITKKVYFVGNSYTDVNNLPDLVQKVAASTNDILQYQATTPGGASLQNHMNNQTVLDNIDNTAWDYVVLQDQSQRPAFGDSYTLPYGLFLSDRIKKAHACTKVLFYMTWGYKNGDAVNCNNGLKFMCTYEGMDDALYNAYLKLAKQNDDMVSPVGRVWRTIRQRYPSMELYSSDNSHPSYLGSLAAAYTFYTMIYKKDPTLASFIGSESSADVAKVKSIVKEIVFDKMSNWIYTKDNTKASFKYEAADAPKVKFTNESTTADAVHWDFGDNSSSTEENPTHTYTSKGEFTVTLTITKCGETYTHEEKVQIETLSLDSFEGVIFSVYPNPATNDLYIYSTQDLHAVIFDMTGKLLNVKIEQQANYYKVDVSHLTQGAYWLQLSADNKTKQVKFIKK